MSVVSGLAKTVIVLAIVVTFVVMASGRCRCGLITTCESYSLSEKIFIGKFVMLTDPNAVLSERKGLFKVIRTLKGETAEMEEVQVAVLCDFEFKAGEEYLVFSYTEPYRNFVCDNTNLAANSSRAIEYADKLRSGPLSFSIEGRIKLPEGNDNFGDVRIEVESSERKDVVPSDKEGSFRFPVSRTGNYRVTVSYPDKWGLTVEHIWSQLKSTASPFRYEVTVDQSGCDYREFQLEASSSRNIWHLEPLYRLPLGNGTGREASCSGGDR